MAGFRLGEMYSFSKGKRASSRRGLRRDGVSRDELYKEKGGKVVYAVWGHPVAVLNPKKKTVWISSAGYHTNLTKNRLNKVIPAGHIYQKNYSWYYATPKGKGLPFKNGMKFKARGRYV